MDVQITQQSSGGDLTLNTTDIAVVYGVENMPFLSMLGGGAFWANDLLLSNGQDWVFDAETEAILKETPLNSGGRIIIENAAKRDLAYLLTDVPGSTLSVSVSITNDNSASIYIVFNGREFNFLWNPTTAS